MKIIISFFLLVSVSSAFSEEKINNVYLNLFLNDKDKTHFVQDTGKEKDTYSHPTGIEIRYLRSIKKIDQYDLMLGLSATSQSQSGVTSKDQDISYGGGSIVRMVRTETNFQNYSLGLISTLSYTMPLFKSDYIFRPFIGFGPSLTESETIQSIMTDKAHPTIFSSHNNYELNSKRYLLNAQLLLGSALEKGDWSVIIEGGYSAIISKSKLNNSLTLNGDEPLTFNDSDYKIADVDQNVASIRFGIGYKF